MQENNASLVSQPPPENSDGQTISDGAQQDRLESLQSYALLDTPPEAGFDRLTALAARLFGVPIAAISFADKHRLWFKSVGGPAQDLLPTEISLDDALCLSALLSPNALVVEDTQLNPCFQNTLLATGLLGARFYAAAPLALPNGIILGTLCLLDRVPRVFSPEQLETLRDLAAAVVSEIELRRTRASVTESTLFYQQMFASNPYPMWVFDAETFQFLDVNQAALTLYGYSRTEFLALTVLDIRPPEERASVQAHLTATVHKSGPGKRNLWRHETKDHALLWMEVSSHAVRYGGRKALMAVAQNVTERCRTEEALRRSEQKFASHVREMPLAAIEIALDMTVTRWNPAAERIFGYMSAEALGRSIMTLIVPEDEQDHVEEVRAGVLLGSGGVRSTNYNRTKSGTRILCDWYNSPLTDEVGRPIGCASLARDVTDETEASERLCRSEAHKAAILNSALDCIISIDHEGRVTDWNPAAAQLFGYTLDEAVGQIVTDLILPPLLQTAYQSGLLFYLQSSDWPACHRRLEIFAQRRDGTQFCAELTATALGNEAQTQYTIYLHDISERKAMEHEREALLVQTEKLLADALERADHDPLTGLLNHRAFHKRLKEAMDAAQVTGAGGAVLLVDLDNFKFFNDAYGHLAGDDVLRRLSSAFQSVCGPADVLARFGGDEFAVLLPGVTAADAQGCADALRQAVSEVSYRPPGYETSIPFTLSVGIACFPGDAATRTALMEAADAKLRVSKSGGDAESPAVSVRRSLAESVGGFTMLDALVTAVDNKDRYTRRHSEGVMESSRQIARALGLDAETLRTIEIAALLHDVGKIGVPDAILRKPGQLSDTDFEAIKQHPVMGAVIVGAVSGFEGALGAIRHHHERWDGGGYPGGLVGEETPLPARLMAVADAYSAMTTDRPYRKGMAPDKARAILEAGAGSQWDPVCVQAFLRVR